MKKAIIAFVFILAGVSAFAQSGVMKELSGQVELKSAPSAAFVAAKAGDIVNQDTVVSTGFKSTALIEVGSTVITVRPLTRLTLTEIRASSESESLSVNLQSGRVRVDVNPPAGTKAQMAVSSPSATASVRGTSFEFDTRSLYVIHGNVAFEGVRGEATVISAGYNTTTDQKGSAVNPLAFGSSAYKPKMPVGAQPNSSPYPTAAASNEGTTSSGPITPTNPTNPTTPTNPATPAKPATPSGGGNNGGNNNGGGGDDGIDVTVGY